MSTNNERYYSLDALRGIMMMLGIVLHAATYHLIEVGMGGGTLSMPIILILGLIHQFRMPLFFVLAGFFAAMLVSKYSFSGLYRNRVHRILYPFLVSLVTFVPLTNWVFFSIPLSVQAGELTMVSSMEQIGASMPQVGEQESVPAFVSLMHLWFLYYLMIFYVTVPALEKATAWLQGGERASRIGRLMTNPWVILLFSATTMITLLPFRGAGVAVADPLFRVNVAALIYYFVFFAAGYVFFGFRDILQTFRNHTGTFGIVALLTFVWYIVTNAMMMAGSESLAVKLVGSLFAGVSTWTFIYFLCGLFLNRFNADTPRTRFLSQASYWVYLFHFPVVLFFGMVMMNLPLGPFVTFIVNSIITAVVCCYTYIWFVRGSWVGQLLNGKRFGAEGKVRGKTAVGAEHA